MAARNLERGRAVPFIRLLVILVSLAAVPAIGIAAASPLAEDQHRLRVTYSQIPLSFEPNQGQSAGPAQFLSRGPGYSVFLTPTEAVLALTRSQPATSRSRERVKTQSAVVRMKLLGGNPEPRVEGLAELPGKSNYFFGRDPKNWRTNVPTFAKVQYRAVYPGVDLVYHGNQRQLEYDFVVAPGADPGQIRLAISGAQALRLSPQGELLLQTPGGTLRQHRPVLYQERGGVRHPVRGGYVLTGKNQIGFQVARYDATKPLVIDPTFSYSTYLGGSSVDKGFGIAVDSAGNAYITGLTASSSFPGTASSPRGYDVFVTKLGAAGGLVYSTLLGGSTEDDGYAIAVDGAGSAYVTGATYSVDFPVTTGAFQRTAGGGSDAFVAKLSATGSLTYSTYLGGSSNDQANGIAVDPSGNACVVGTSFSSNFPTAVPAQAAARGGGDAFVAKLNATGAGLFYSTYWGGSGADQGNGIAVDSSGAAYITGYTQSTNLSTTPGAFRTVHSTASATGFVSKFTAAGSVVYSTYLGGSGGEQCYGIAVDASGSTYVTGYTYSSDFPLLNPIDGTLNSNDAFVTKLNSTGSGLLYSTFLGGSGAETGYGIAVDSGGNAYVTGSTNSTNFPVVNALQSTYAGGTSDAFLAELNAAGSAVVYSSYLGGIYSDIAHAVAVNPLSGTAYVAGETNSNNFPTANAFMSTKPDLSLDAFVAEILSAGGGGSGDTTPPTVSITSPANGATVSGTVTVQASASDNVGVASVSFYIDSVLKATATVAPYVYSWNTTGLTGVHTVAAIAKDAAGNSSPTAQISVTVGSTGDTTPPSVSITSPANGATVSGIVTVQASASDNVGVASVSFYIDSVLKATATVAPYVYSWNTTGLTGVHTVAAIAKDAAGNSSPTAQISVTVGGGGGGDTTPPTVSITSPANGATVSGTVTVQASASDNVGVASVSFYIDSVLKATATVAPYVYSWNTTGLTGSHTVAAIAKDAAGNSSPTAQISVTVSGGGGGGGGDTIPPTVSITSPANGTTVTGTVSVTANVSDNVGVASASFYIDGKLQSTLTAPPYTWSWNTNFLKNNTNHTLMVTARDAAGNTASASETVKVH